MPHPHVVDPSAYVTALMAQVVQEREFPVSIIAHLQLLLPRILALRFFRHRERSMGDLSSTETSRIVRVLFLIDMDNMENAAQPARFGNGDWTDIERVFPLLEPLLGTFGTIGTVTEGFLSVVEHSLANYPLQRFADHLDLIFSQAHDFPLAWRGSLIPGRLAALIQRFSETHHPLAQGIAHRFLRILDALVDMGDRRAAAIQTSEIFKDVRRA